MSNPLVQALAREWAEITRRAGERIPDADVQLLHQIAADGTVHALVLAADGGLWRLDPTRPGTVIRSTLEHGGMTVAWYDDHGELLDETRVAPPETDARNN